MKFKTDENVPIDAAEELRNAGYDAMTVMEQQMSGMADSGVAEVCIRENRVLVTRDLDFSDIRRYPPSNFPGLIVLRPTVQSSASIRRIVAKTLAVIQVEPLVGRLWIVDEGQVRIRAGTSNSS